MVKGAFRMIAAIMFGFTLLAASGLAYAADMSPLLPAIISSSVVDSKPISVIVFLDSRLTMDEVYPEAKSRNMNERRAFVVDRLKERYNSMSRDVSEYISNQEKLGNVSLYRPLWIINAIRLTATAEVITKIARDFPEVVYVVHDPLYNNTLDIGWGVFETGAPQVWSTFGAKGAGVLIGHKDSGVNFLNCSKFDGRIWFNPGEDLNGNGTLDAGEANGIDDDGNRYVDDFYGWNFDENNNDVSDRDGHGSLTSSVICANLTGVCDTTSMAPEAKLVILSGYRSQGAVLESSQYAVENGVNVISASLSFKQSECQENELRECPNRVAHRWVAEMELAAGIIHANSTGNEGLGNPRPLSTSCPSDCPPPAMTEAHWQQGGVSSIVSVAAYVSNGNFYTGSGVGPAAWSRDDICVHERVPWCGPQGSLSSYPDELNDYPYANGNHGLLKPDITAPSSVTAVTANCGCGSVCCTSGATPHVGGALAIIYSAFPGISPEEAYQVLVNGALDAGDPGPDTTWGFGKLRLLPAIQHGDNTLGSVAGNVTSNGQDLEGVRVSVEGANPVWTDADGNYELFLRPGTYTGLYEKFGYQTVSRNINIVAGQVDDGSLTLNMSANASLVMTVVDQFDVPMPGILVEHPLSGISLYSDANGQVTFGTMFDGVQEFQVAQNTEVYEHTVHHITLTAGNNTTELALVPSAAFGPTGPDEYGYYAYDDLDAGGPTYDWVEIAGGLGTNLNLSGDSFVMQTLPFQMQFYGNQSNSLAISSNGNIIVGGPGSNDWGRWPIPAPSAPNNYIAVLYQDYRPEGGGGVWYYYDQAAGRAIIQWEDVPEYFNYGRATFQIHIYDPSVNHDHLGNSVIEMHYADFVDRFDATTGIENADGSVGLEYSFNRYYGAGSTPIRAGRAIRFTTDQANAVDDDPIGLPNEYALLQNYPNPFNSQTTFRFNIPQAGQVVLKLYDITGRETATLFDGVKQAGAHSVSFDATGLSTGIYFARMEANGNIVGAKKVLYLK